MQEAEDLFWAEYLMVSLYFFSVTFRGKVSFTTLHHINSAEGGMNSLCRGEEDGFLGIFLQDVQVEVARKGKLYPRFLTSRGMTQRM